MSPRQIKHLETAMRLHIHCADLMATHVKNGGAETALYRQVIKDIATATEEVKLMLDLEAIGRGLKPAPPTR